MEGKDEEFMTDDMAASLSPRSDVKVNDIGFYQSPQHHADIEKSISEMSIKSARSENCTCCIC